MYCYVFMGGSLPSILGSLTFQTVYLTTTFEYPALVAFWLFLASGIVVVNK